MHDVVTSDAWNVATETGRWTRAGPPLHEEPLPRHLQVGRRPRTGLGSTAELKGVLTSKALRTGLGAPRSACCLPGPRWSPRSWGLNGPAPFVHLNDLVLQHTLFVSQSLLERSPDCPYVEVGEYGPLRSRVLIPFHKGRIACPQARLRSASSSSL